MNKLTFSTEKYNFASIVKNWLQVDDLTKLQDYKTYSEDQSTNWNELFYMHVGRDEVFLETYREFLFNIVKPRYNNEEIVFQAVPTFKVHLAGSAAGGEWRKDKYYRDEVWATRIKELNYYLPLTDTNETNTIWSESEEGKDDFSPMLLKHGECMEWDGTNLLYGSKTNKSDSTRVSVHFRVMPYSTYLPNDQCARGIGVPFKIGGYYDTSSEVMPENT